MAGLRFFLSIWMNRIMRAWLLTIPLFLAACGTSPGHSAANQTDGQTPSATEATASMPPPPVAQQTPQASPTADMGDLQAAPLAPDAQKGEKGARQVLIAWAHALERKQFDKAYAQYGDQARQSVTARQLADRFNHYARISVTVPGGTMEGAAGSLYYTAPTTITGTRKDGGTDIVRGDVVLKRVNDVPGASAEQLRWHIYSADLE